MVVWNLLCKNLYSAHITSFIGVFYLPENKDCTRLCHPYPQICLLCLKHVRKLSILSQQLTAAPSLQFISHAVEYISLPYAPIHPDHHYISLCGRLRTFRMFHTNLQSLSSIGLHDITTTIEDLYLAHNNITSLSDIENLIFHKLHSLNLDNNRITCFRGQQFKFPALKYLKLKSNLLTNVGDLSRMVWGVTLPQHSIVRVHFAGDPWHCNGSFDWLMEGFYGRCYNAFIINFRRYPYRIVIDSIMSSKCNTPSGRAGSTLVSEEVIHAAMLQVNICDDDSRESLHVYITVTS